MEHGLIVALQTPTGGPVTFSRALLFLTEPKLGSV